MNTNLFLGTVLLVVGAVLLYFGYTSSQSLGEQVHETFMGRFTESTTWYFVLGIAAAIGGVILLAFKARP